MLFRSDENAIQIKPRINIINTGPASVPLSLLKLRYFYTKEGTEEEEFHIDYSVLGGKKVIGSVYDGYGEVSFTSESGFLGSGQQTGEIQIRINKRNWTPYNQSNDYSFSPQIETYTEYKKIALYLEDTLIWGNDPLYPTPGSTNLSIILGDVNGDGTVAITDALLTAQYYIGLEPEGFIIAAGDVDKNGEINIVDALLIAQFYVGIITEF